MEMIGNNINRLLRAAPGTASAFVTMDMMEPRNVRKSIKPLGHEKRAV
jgi:low affinity Fe/Cu permease